MAWSRTSGGQDGKYNEQVNTLTHLVGIGANQLVLTCNDPPNF
jgi:hypothetical protein